MKILDVEKLNKLTSFNDELDMKHGAPGIPSRKKFDEESLAWFYGKFVPTFMQAIR